MKILISNNAHVQYPGGFPAGLQQVAESGVDLDPGCDERWKHR